MWATHRESREADEVARRQRVRLRQHAIGRPGLHLALHQLLEAHHRVQDLGRGAGEAGPQHGAGLAAGEAGNDVVG